MPPRKRTTSRPKRSGQSSNRGLPKPRRVTKLSTRTTTPKRRAKTPTKRHTLPKKVSPKKETVDTIERLTHEQCKQWSHLTRNQILGALAISGQASRMETISKQTDEQLCLMMSGMKHELLHDVLPKLLDEYCQEGKKKSINMNLLRVLASTLGESSDVSRFTHSQACAWLQQLIAKQDRKLPQAGFWSSLGRGMTSFLTTIKNWFWDSHSTVDSIVKVMIFWIAAGEVSRYAIVKAQLDAEVKKALMDSNWWRFTQAGTGLLGGLATGVRKVLDVVPAAIDSLSSLAYSLGAGSILFWGGIGLAIALAGLGISLALRGASDAIQTPAGKVVAQGALLYATGGTSAVATAAAASALSGRHKRRGTTPKYIAAPHNDDTRMIVYESPRRSGGIASSSSHRIHGQRASIRLSPRL